MRAVGRPQGLGRRRGAAAEAEAEATRRDDARDDDDAVVSRNYDLVLKGHARSVTVNSAKAVGGVSVDVGGAAASAAQSAKFT